VVVRTRSHANLIDLKRPGDLIPAKDWNLIAENLNRQNTGIDPPRQLDGVAHDLIELVCGRFRIKSIQGDYLICITWDGFNEGSENINVARPYLLRTVLSSHNDVTFVYPDNVTRTASATGETDETQVIVPAYAVDDEIIAIKGIIRGTGSLSVNNRPIVWQDMNIDARAWAKQAA